jgi:heptosyltransferase II
MRSDVHGRSTRREGGQFPDQLAAMRSVGVIRLVVTEIRLGRRQFRTGRGGINPDAHFTWEAEESSGPNQADEEPECTYVGQASAESVYPVRFHGRSTFYSERLKFERILVRAANWVGDAVMSLPALQALRRNHPEAQITVLAKPWVAGLYARESFCQEVIPYEVAKGWQSVGERWELAKRLRARHFDAALLMQNSFDSALLAAMARIPVRVGYARDGRSALLTSAVPVPERGDIPAHQRFYYLELLKRAGCIREYSTVDPIRLEHAYEAAEAGRQRYSAACVTGRVVGVGPGAAYGGAKRWLTERFAEAAVETARTRGASVAVFGSKQEFTICEEVRERVESAGISALNFAGATTLKEFIELAAACDLFLTNDSGPMHIASALGVPTVAIFGATDDHATGPTGEQSRVVREPVICSPCLLRECPIDHRCMTSVTARRVADAALELVEIQQGKRLI